MTAIHIRKKLDSATLPELEPLLGKTVEITIEEAVEIIPGAADWDAAEKAMREITDYDYDALAVLDAASTLGAEELP